MAIRSTMPSRWWVVVTVTVAILSVAAGLGAILNHREETRLIGEGQVLWRDGQSGLRRIERELAAGGNPEQAVRRLRNSQESEAIALLDATGVVIASSSPTLVNKPLDSPTLQEAISDGRFAAVATEIEHDLMLDGVREWESGEALYLSLVPGKDRHLLSFYDIGELMGRRIRSEGIQAGTMQLAAVSLVLLLSAALTLAGRSRAVRRFREISLEAEYIHKEKEVLHRHNAELQEARNKAERALDLAEENNRIRSEFVLMINHELRTPLTSVVTGAELLRTSDRLDTDERDILESVTQDGRRLESMIDQLLALARVENRGLSFSPQPVVLRQLCRQAREAHGRAAHRGGTASHRSEENVEVLTDVQTLTQLVASLVDNAYTHGATSVELDCSTSPSSDPHLVVGVTPDRAAAISVIDDGPGIKAAFLPRAFEKFEKDSRSSGTGLGLYMARLMAEAIGAALHIWTSPEGTTISIVMPLSDAQPHREAA